MTEAEQTMELLDEALDALRQMIVSGIRVSAPLVRRCGELADELRGTDLHVAKEQLRALAAADDDGAQIAPAFRALAAVRHARVRLTKPAKADAAPQQ
jgi:hypothetical protein